MLLLKDIKKQKGCTKKQKNPKYQLIKVGIWDFKYIS